MSKKEEYRPNTFNNLMETSDRLKHEDDLYASGQYNKGDANWSNVSTSMVFTKLIVLVIYGFVFAALLELTGVINVF